MADLIWQDINLNRLRFAVDLLNKYSAYDRDEAKEDLEALIRLAERSRGSK